MMHLAALAALAALLAGCASAPIGGGLYYSPPLGEARLAVVERAAAPDCSRALGPALGVLLRLRVAPAVLPASLTAAVGCDRPDVVLVSLNVLATAPAEGLATVLIDAAVRLDLCPWPRLPSPALARALADRARAVLAACPAPGDGAAVTARMEAP